MKRWVQIALWSVGGAVAFILGSLGLLFYLSPSSNPTQGPQIGAYAAPRTALLVIDIQEDYTGPRAKQPYKDAGRILAATNALIEEAREKGNLVVFIENILDNPILKVVTGGINAPGAPGTEMDSRLIRIPGTQTFTKLQGDAFSNLQFDAYLRANQVNQVLIVGLDATLCVNATARGALNRGYKVTMFSKAIASHSAADMGALSQGWRNAGAIVI